MAKLIGALAVCGLLLGAATVRADQQVSFAYQMPMKVSLNVNSSGCDNSPGPFITLNGKIALGGLQAQCIFQNNVKGTHRTTATVVAPSVLLPAGGSIVIPKQPSLTGVGGNPWIYLQFFNAQGNLTPQILLGRCVQGLTVEQDLLNTALASVFVAASECSNNPGPWITFGGDITLSGLNCRVIFKNNVKGTHTKPVTAKVELVAEGTKIVIPKQPSQDGVGGNPWIWVQFLDDASASIGTPFFLGRCSEM